MKHGIGGAHTSTLKWTEARNQDQRVDPWIQMFDADKDCQEPARGKCSHWNLCLAVSAVSVVTWNQRYKNQDENQKGTLVMAQGVLVGCG